MSTKKLLILTGVFLALLGFVVFYERFQPTSEEALKARKKLLDFKAENLSGMTVERPDLPKVELSKAGKERWLLAGEPADGAVVSGVVADLGRLELVGETRTSFDPKEFGLDVQRAKVVMAFADGSKADLVFGKEIPGTDTTAAASGGRFGAVRYAPVASLVKPVDDFRSKVLFETPSSEITRVTVSRGAARVVVARSAAEGGKLPEWRIEEPIRDLASRSFVEQLLADLSGARISEFPAVSGAELARIGLQPPLVTVDLQKGAESVAALAFGAARADAAGKLYARRGKTVVVVDDRLQENLAKELTAYREKRIFPVDVWSTVRVSVDAGSLKVGAEKVEGEWLSGGKPVAAAAAEDLLERIGRVETTSFVARKEFPAFGLPAQGKKLPAPALLLEVAQKGEPARTVRFFEAGEASGKGRYLADVSGRADGMVVERSALDEIKALAAKVVPTVKAVPPAKSAPPAKTAAPVPAKP